VPTKPPFSLPSLRRLLIALAWIALTTTFFFPTKEVVNASLDFSNYGSYAYFTARDFHYGSDVVPMCGPYGFVMYGFVHGGNLFWTRVILELSLKGVLAGLAIWFWFSAKGSPWLRCWWLVCLVVFMVGIEDYPQDWLIFLSGIWIIYHTREPGSLRRPMFAAFVLGLVALIKGTHLVLALATLGTALIPVLFRREWRTAFAVLGVFFASLFGWWLLAGQRLLDLPLYVKGILELSSGYNLAMVLNEGAGTFWRGVSLALLLGTLFAWGLWIGRRQLATIASLLLLTGFTFLKWKHGFVRSDGHIFMFFCFGMVAASTWLLLFPVMQPVDNPLRGPTRWFALIISCAAMGIALVGLGDGYLKNSRWVYQLYPQWLREKVVFLMNPHAAKVVLDAELQSRERFYRMPVTRELVGREKIDMFGFEHGITLLNDLHYSPRPIGGGAFSTFTPYLMRLNGKFMEDEKRRPGYFLLKYQTVDNRLAAQDDPLTFLGMLAHYSPVLMEQNYVLLKQHEARDTSTPEPLGTVPIRFNETVPVPTVGPDRILLASFDIRPSLLGRIRATLYKPPLIFINQLGKALVNGESRRLVPSMAQIPFPVSPVIETNEDVLTLYTRQEGKPLYSFTLTTERPEAFAPEMTVTFSSIPRPPLPDRTDMDELLTSARYPLTNVVPDEIIPADAPLRQLGGVHVQMMLPPAELIWKLDGNEREFLFDYGYDPTAYAQPHGNGTLFIVEIRAPGQPAQEIFRRLLHPAKRPTERDTQTARVILPGAIRAGSKLVLRTDPGEFGDNAWDWAFVTKIQIKRGDYSPRQFPAFNRVPALASMEQTNIMETDQGRVLILHAPGSLDFLLQGNESTLSFDFGFMPGAYTGEGSTDGAVYTIELVRPNHPKEILFRRHLEPRTRPEDQGRQHAKLTLPALGPADHLVLNISAGPSGNNSWDWTYVTNFELK
jgi:hypothetical protein